MANTNPRGRADSRSASIQPQKPENTQTMDDLLVVFERLEVGPVRLEDNRLIAPYRLTVGEQTHQTELIYRYEEPVFDPEEPESQNLAAMIAAQVALNYGLFCRQLIFHGRYDATDRRFIRDMAENTAREIFVKKFLEPNPFLEGPAAHLSPVKLPRYLQATILFSEKATGGGNTQWQLWPTDRQRHCVLSSGGKDSLLSYGLLNEIGREVHPIFVNESGRHWFTALNAYRHCRDHVPNTARVWVNSDRLFAWMLARMPFIRKNFADIRSDEYPIRLWTVAVFLFGVLPLMRKRGLGRILIGDEFDTTVRVKAQGITHYDGLFDQSRYFDNTLSRYFMRKGWAISQFSVLRPLSELLIEKILAERYPQLQAQQTSCHAAHKTKDRIAPCGKCEKCRRIVCMLMAIDIDPRQCGYSEMQITHCLQSFIDKGVSQETAGKLQLTAMLMQKGLIDIPSGKRSRGQSHPEILQLRFDAKRSPLDAIPVDLRKPLWTIFLDHAHGAVKQSGRRWETYDLLGDSTIESPYAFEPPLAGPNTQSKTNRRTLLWGEMNWPQAKQRLQRIDIALMPVGAIEQHGPHLPLDTDAFDADYLARRVAAACGPPRPLVLPVISFGVSYHHEQFKGTLSISNETLSRLA